MSKESYRELRHRQQKEHDSFTGIGACIAPQFEAEFFKKLEVKSFGEVTHLGFGMFCRNDRLNDYKAMMDRHHQELKDAIKADEKGDGFVAGMFYYELANHECQLTGDPTDALMALGFTRKQVLEDKKLKRGYDLAVNKLMREE